MLTRLAHALASANKQIELEKRRVAELDQQIERTQARIVEQRKKMGGVNAARENNQQIQKQIKILENRLDQALVKYNEALAHNRGLRDRIDNLRRERLVFDQIYRKLEKELAEKKKEMARIIEVSNRAYESRDSALNEMAALKAQAEKEQAAFEQEWRELGKLIEQDRKMKDFVKARDGGTGATIRDHMSPEQESKLRRKVIRGNWSIAKDKASQQVSMERVQSYGEAFAKIQESTGVTDIDELVTTFINAEDQNFSLFNYVNELNHEIERLEGQIEEIKGDIDKHRGQGINTDNQRKKILKDLEERLSRTEGKAEVYEQKHGAAMKTVNALKQGIQQIFTRIGCNTPASREMLGDGGVTDENMMQYLGIIELRTNELLQMYAASMATGSGGGGGHGGAEQGTPASIASILGQGPQVPPGSVSMQIEPPSTTDDAAEDSDSDDDLEDGRPLTRDELKAKTVKSISKRGPKGTNSKGGTARARAATRA